MRDKLLLVDDDALTRELLEVLLAKEGWQVTVAENGDAALGIIRGGLLPDVVLTDLRMPGLNGSKFAAAVRAALPTSATLTLIAMTATASPTTPEQFDALLLKPFSPAEVRETCERLWAATTSAGMPEVLASSKVRNDDVEPVVDHGTLARMRTSMPPSQLRALYHFAVTDAEARIARMHAATLAGDAETLRREAHALKGSCGMVGALRLRALADAVERGGLATFGTPTHDLHANTLTEWKPLHDFHAEVEKIRLMLLSLFGDA